jgi:hypothetical protein
MRTFLIATTSAAALFASSAFTQERSQGTESLPDFSGIWGNPYLYGVEPPLSGPGPTPTYAGYSIGRWVDEDGFGRNHRDRPRLDAALDRGQEICAQPRSASSLERSQLYRKHEQFADRHRQGKLFHER